MRLPPRAGLGALCLVIAGCKPAAPAPAPAPKEPYPPPFSGLIEGAPAPAGTPRFLALGDSYTIGQGVGAAERWPNQLVAALNKQGVSVAEPTILAQTGWTTGDLSAALDRAALKGPYDLVSLLIGVNDQYQGGRADDYRAPFAALLKRAVALAGGRAGRVLVVSIPDYGATPFGQRRGAEAIGQELDQFNAVNRAEAARAGAHYVEVTKASRRAKDDPSLTAPDELHPSGRMYAQWAEAALPLARKALGAGKE